jgi:hypothetical protein
MRTFARAALAVAIACGVVNQSGGAIVQADETNKGAGGHASLRAYKDAVVSATDPGSGITVSVDPDGAAVTARDRGGTVLWHADVLKVTGRPSEGFAVVRRVEIGAAGTVELVVGKHLYVEADLKSGRLKLMGED